MSGGNTGPGPSRMRANTMEQIAMEMGPPSTTNTVCHRVTLLHFIRWPVKATRCADESFETPQVWQTL